VRDRLLRDGFLLLSIAFVGFRLFSIEPWDDSVDAYAYWATGDGDLYGDAVSGRIGAYLYSPAFAQLIWPLTHLPWPAFAALWTALNCAVLWWLLGRLALPSLLFLPISFEIISGNVHLLIAAVIVAGFRYPALWVLPVITKLTPGIGLLWFLVRREWRALAIALGTSGVVVAISVLLAPDAWRQWIELLTRDIGAPLVTPGWYLPVPLLLRLPVAAAIVAWGAFTDRRWALPIGVTLTLPIVWLNSLAILAAVVPLARWRLGVPSPAVRMATATQASAG
jgi:hypothetical protein